MSAYFTPAPRVLAHRGFALHYPENTLAAFHEAIDVGVTHIETDVWASRDGSVVMWHDSDLGRLLGDSRKIAQLTRREIEGISVEGQGIAFLEDALSAFPEVRFNIDLKSEAALDPTIKVIERAKAQERVLLASFNDARRLRAAARLPGVAHSAGSRAITRIVLSRWRSEDSRRRQIVRALAGASAVQIPETHAGIPILSAQLLSDMRHLGVAVHVWTVNDPQRIQYLYDIGVDAVVTDRADIAVPIAAKHFSV